jgi:hypothetical protein
MAMEERGERVPELAGGTHPVDPDVEQQIIQGSN